MNPFQIDGPAVISVSGGRTSAMMLRQILDAHGGALPPDVVAAFANTGREMPATLAFVGELSRRWSVPIAWVEYRQAAAVRDRWQVVTEETASRKGEPFDAVIDSRSYLPNPIARFCTVEMKIKPIEFLARSLGFDEWANVIGLRADEPRRVARHRERNPEALFPLHAAGITRTEVMAFWASQPFDLGLRPWESNCDLCFLKGANYIDRILRDHPETGEGWEAAEKRTGARFRNDRGSYAFLRKKARLPLLPMAGLDDGDPTAIMDCACTD
jgi:hypothetical protein